MDERDERRLERMEEKIDAILAWQNQQIGCQKSDKKWSAAISAGVSIAFSGLIALLTKKPL